MSVGSPPPPHRTIAQLSPGPAAAQAAMAQVNGNYLKLKAGYLFPEIARRVKAFSEANPTAQVIR
ncbi:MAG: hypothetical protein ACO231_05230, partial [Prochlorococcaceae cyanobacterium]